MKDATSKFIFALIIVAVLTGWVYTLFEPTHTVKNNLELNANYYPGISPEVSSTTTVEGSTSTRIEESTVTYTHED